MSSNDLKGKITVIKFWGVWCGWCVKEMPEFQEFCNKFKNDPGVAVLTIDARDSVSTVQEFMAKKQYSFPVLLEGDYMPKARVVGFPTAWFVDSEGKKVFEQVGASKELIEEFTWRVSAMMK